MRLDSRLFALSVPVLLAALAPSSPALANCKLHGTPVEGVQSVVLPEQAGPGPDQEVRPALEAPFLKLAVLTLRRGTVLPTHDAPVPVSIMALSGSGVVKLGDKTLPLDSGHMVVLPPKVAHEVVPENGQDLVVLVHYLKTASCSTEKAAGAPAADAAHAHGETP